MKIEEEIRNKLPKWLKKQNEGKWIKWVNTKTVSCRNREVKYLKKKKDNIKIPHSSSEWREAVLKALNNCKDGKAIYSKYKLDINLDSSNPYYPSIEHIERIDKLNLGVEIRIVNDMKSILSEDEFFEFIIRLYEKNNLKNKKISNKGKIKIDKTF
ncbi:MAG: hypothetical protein ACTSV5_09915 [Promethearchaeota archaeon]